MQQELGKVKGLSNQIQDIRKKIKINKRDNNVEEKKQPQVNFQAILQTTASGRAPNGGLPEGDDKEPEKKIRINKTPFNNDKKSSSQPIKFGSLMNKTNNKQEDEQVFFEKRLEWWQKILLFLADVVTIGLLHENIKNYFENKNLKKDQEEYIKKYNLLKNINNKDYVSFNKDQLVNSAFSSQSTNNTDIGNYYKGNGNTINTNVTISDLSNANYTITHSHGI